MVELEVTETEEKEVETDEPVRLEVVDDVVSATDEEELEDADDNEEDVPEVKLVEVELVVEPKRKLKAAKAPTAITKIITTTTTMEAVLLIACLNFDDGLLFKIPWLLFGVLN